MIAHWMASAVKRAGLPGAEHLVFSPDAGVHEVWQKACDVCSVTPERLAEAIASVYSMDVVDLNVAEPTAAKLLPGSVARKFCVFPIRDENRYLIVATPNPTDPYADQEVGFTSGRLARFAVAPPTDIKGAIDSTYSTDITAATMLDRLGLKGADARVEVEESAERASTEGISAGELASGPVVRLANIILSEAVKQRASDIHIQPLSGDGVVRFRTDGVLHNAMQLPLPVLARVVSRIKIMAKLDITDRLRPQDGRARMVIEGHKYDLRVSTVPTRGAEKAVVRILDTDAGGTLNETGIAPAEIARLRRALSHRDGIIVVTGPTGSGKTTTLYGALREIATDDVNIMTVEDPVEYEVPGLTQIQVEHKQGMTFASALRAILRQDPDVIFVGEIRDPETAHIAAQASLTGHVVLSTLHTNDAVGSIRRFLDLGLNAPTLGETLRGALAQRLVRRVCPHCAEPVGDALSAEEEDLAAKYGTRPTVRAKGCEACLHHGYLGRLPVTELLVPTPELVQLMMSGAAPHHLHREAVRSGMTTMLESALQRVQAGETTLQEVERVIGDVDRRDDPSPASAPSGVGVAGGGGEPSGAGPGPVASGPSGSPRPAPAPRRSEGSVGLMEAAPSAAAAAAPTAQVAPSTDEVPHVLIVDDDATTRAIARAVLETVGYRVSEAHDGAEALVRLARGEHFSLMLLDLEMPTVNGRDVLRSVRQSMLTMGLPVVVLTGSPDHSAEVELMELGADDYLRKPIDPPLLSTRVKAAMRRARG